MEEFQHYNITISGNVQGVGFRYSAVKMARSLNLKGFVRNLPDGNVYAEAEGSEDQLQRFVSWCYIGPRYSNVKDVSIEAANLKDYTGFDVKG